jgi:hypothetical protein
MNNKYVISLYVLAVGLAVAFVVTAATVSGFAQN